MLHDLLKPTASAAQTGLLRDANGKVLAQMRRYGMSLVGELLAGRSEARDQNYVLELDTGVRHPVVLKQPLIFRGSIIRINV